MSNIGRCIFKAIYEGKWLSIEYENKQGEHTKYWIGIKNINTKSKVLEVVGMHIFKHSTMDMHIFISGIKTASVIDGTYFERNESLIEDVELYPHKYEFIFKNAANLKVLNYLSDCNRLDNIPYRSDYSLVNRVDGEVISNDVYQLDEDQFTQLVNNYQKKATGILKSRELKEVALNMLKTYILDDFYEVEK